MKSTLVLAAVIAVLPGALAVCCNNRNQYHFCFDNTKPTPCCGYQGCNIFCCSCSGGCRGYNGRFALARGESVDTSVEGDISATTEAFLLADTDSKGYLTLDDYLKHMEVEENHEMWIDWFKRHDQNGDRKLTVEEVHTVEEDVV